jgi:S1-C subfamily serine protease
MKHGFQASSGMPRVRPAHRPACAGGPALLLTLVMAALAGAVVPIQAQDLTQEERQRMYHEVKPAVVFVGVLVEGQIQINLGEEMIQGTASIPGGGSGFLITPDGYLVTNGHVVANYHSDNEEQLKLELLYQFLGNEYLPQVQAAIGRALTQEELAQFIPELIQRAQVGMARQLVVVLQNGESFPAEIKQYSPMMSPFAARVSFPGMSLASGKDVAILKIEGRDLPTVALGESGALTTGEDVHAAGYPGVVSSHRLLSERTRLEPSFTRGGVSAVRAAVAGNEVIQFDAATTHGNSGGPILNNRGEVVGMVTLGAVGQTAGGDAVAVQGFNFAVPTNTIREFIRSEGLTPSTAGLFNETWRTALDAYYGGRWSEAVTAFDEVLRVHTGFPDAQQLRSTAMSRRGTEVAEASPAPPAGEEGPWMMVALVALGLGLVGASLFFRNRTAPAGAGGGGGVATAARPSTLGGGGGAAAALAPGAPLLVVKEGPLAGNRFSVTSGGVKIGRDPSACQVVLNETATSREHAIVLPAEGGGVTIRNLSGTNPTYVNGRPIQEATLAPGDRIRIAGTVIGVEQGGGGA